MRGSYWHRPDSEWSHAGYPSSRWPKLSNRLGKSPTGRPLKESAPRHGRRIIRQWYDDQLDSVKPLRGSLKIRLAAAVVSVCRRQAHFESGWHCTFRVRVPGLRAQSCVSNFLGETSLCIMMMISRCRCHWRHGNDHHDCDNDCGLTRH